jgi:hypothetical protein
MVGSRGRFRIAVLACCTAACGNAREAPSRPDAGLQADARSTDAPAIDAPVIDSTMDDDRDGHTADVDCNDEDSTVWQNLVYAFRDADGDGHTVAASGTICSGVSLPPGYSALPSDPDCNDADPAAFNIVTGFVDIDGDGFGVGLEMAFCNTGTLPFGFAPVDGDCAADDAARWVELPYSFRDADGDGAAVAELGVVCSGDSLPPGYLPSAPVGRPLDCDDADPTISIALTVFVDADRDGFGTEPGQLACTSGSPPPGFSTSDTDCDDNDMTVWLSLVYTAVDRDDDHVTAPELGTRCTAGTLLPPYFATPNGNDCDDSDPTVSVALTVFADGDLDGVGAGPGQLMCTNGSPPAGFSTSGTDCDDDDPALTHLAVLYPDQDSDGVGTSPRSIVCIGAAIPAGLARGGYDEDDADRTVIETEDFDDLLELLLLDG